jgi:hypothetical protein
MKNVLLIILFLLSFNILLGQNESEFLFQPIRIHSRVDQKAIETIQFKHYIKNTSFFFAEKIGNEQGLFLVEKKLKDWIVYDYNDFISNMNVGEHKIHSKRYVSITVSAMRSGNGENYYGWYVLFDLERKTYLILNNFSHNSDDDKNHEKYINTRECNSKVVYQNGILKITRKCNPNKEENYCDNCMESGEYRISNSGLNKQKR